MDKNNHETNKAIILNKIHIQEINIKIQRAKKLTKTEQNIYLIPAIMKLNIYKKRLRELKQRKLF